jgi:hypothetical protein
VKKRASFLSRASFLADTVNTLEFKEKARKIISDTLLDHVKEYRGTGLAGRAEENRDRDPSQFEREINVSDKDEGITNAHVLMVIISRLVSLQRRIQIQKSNDRKKILDSIQKELKELNELRHSTEVDSEEETEILESIDSVTQELKRDAETIDEACKTRIWNFELDTKGKNNSITYQIVKERKSRKQIQKLIVGQDEYTDITAIRAKLEERYEVIVRQPFRTESDIQDFIDEYKIDFDTAQNTEWLEEEFTEQEVLSVIKNASKNAAPGPPGHTPGICICVHFLRNA